MLQWGRNFIVAETRMLDGDHRAVHAASMGPQLYRCRNGIKCLPTNTAAAWLQWGRNFIVAETACPLVGDIGVYHASMGPQLYRCGNLFLTKETAKCYIRFNGAATLSLRKRLNVLAELLRIATLQWGRNFIVAETGDRHCRQVSATALQWGRNFIVAETWQICISAMLKSIASMGPQLYRCGNQRRNARLSTQPNSFNGAATLSLRKRMTR